MHLVRTAFVGLAVLSLLSCRPIDSPTPNASQTPSPVRSPGGSAVATSTPSPGPVVDPTNVTRLCEVARFDTPSDLACSEAVAAALGAMGLMETEVVRAEVRWQLICRPDTPCPTPEPNAVEVVVLLRTGDAVSATVRRDSDGRLHAGPPVPVHGSALATPPPFDPPAAGRYDLGEGLPNELATRSPAPLCGEEDAGMAGPFDSAARKCFLDSVLNRSAAEFLSHRADIEGAGFTELWRFGGKGPLVVYTETRGVWQKLLCALLLVGGNQVLDHTDCAYAPLS